MPGNGEGIVEILTAEKAIRFAVGTFSPTKL
jgi:hypothetical protein